MAEKQLVSFPLVFLASVTVLFAGHAHGSDICLKADYGPLCRSVVKDVADPYEATKTTIDHLISETKRAKDASAKYGKSQTLSVCKQNFDDAISNLKKCLENLKSHDKPSLNINLSAALTAYVTCDDAVAEGGSDGMSGITNTDTTLRHLASNSLYLASLTAENVTQ